MAARAGWIDQSKPATAKQLKDFVGGWSAQASALVPLWPVPGEVGFGPNVAKTWGRPFREGWQNFATEVGFAGAFGGHDLYLNGSYSWLLLPYVPGW